MRAKRRYTGLTSSTCRSAAACVRVTSNSLIKQHLQIFESDAMAGEHVEPLLRVIVCFCILVLANADLDGCPNVIEKEKWGARRYKATNYLVTPIPYVVIHQTRTPDCSNFSECAKIIGAIQDARMDDLHWNDIGDSFLVGGDGSVYEGTGWFMEGAHTHLYNRKSISIAFIGYYHNTFRNSTHEITMLKEASQKSLKAAHDLIICGKNRGYLRQNVKVIGARQVRPTVNPGDLVFEQIQQWPEWSVVDETAT